MHSNDLLALNRVALSLKEEHPTSAGLISLGTLLADMPILSKSLQPIEGQLMKGVALLLQGRTVKITIRIEPVTVDPGEVEPHVLH